MQLVPMGNMQALGEINARRGEEHDNVLMEKNDVSHEAPDKPQARCLLTLDEKEGLANGASTHQLIPRPRTLMDCHSPKACPHLRWRIRTIRSTG